MFRRLLPVAVATGIAASSIAASTPAAAHDTRATGGAPLIVTTWSGVEVYLDRPTTQHLAATVRNWTRTSDLPTVFATAAGCVRLGNPIAAGACAAAITLAGAYTLDRLEQADRQHTCLRLSVTWTGPALDVYDGTRCHGTRTPEETR